jgi:hypothetical protein
LARGGDRLRVDRLGGGGTAANLLRLEAVVAGGAALPPLEGRGSGQAREGVSCAQELDVQGVYGPEGPRVGLPVEVSEGQAGEEAWGEELVDIVRVVVLDCELSVCGV